MCSFLLMIHRCIYPQSNWLSIFKRIEIIASICLRTINGIDWHQCFIDFFGIYSLCSAVRITKRNFDNSTFVYSPVLHLNRFEFTIFINGQIKRCMFGFGYQYQISLQEEIKLCLQYTEIAFVFSVMGYHLSKIQSETQVSSGLAWWRIIEAFTDTVVSTYGVLFPTVRLLFIKGSCSIQLSYRTRFCGGENKAYTLFCQKAYLFLCCLAVNIYRKVGL